MTTIEEFRITLTVRDFDRAAGFYRDTLGLQQRADWSGDDGRVVLLALERATLELFDDAQVAMVDTPWGDRNVRLRTPDGVQLTLFTPGAQ